MKSSCYSIRWRMLLALSATLVVLSGCASVNEKVTQWLSSSVDAVAMFDGKILRGKANFSSEREATFQLQSSDRPSLTCFGALRYTATSSGVVDFSCNDGRTITTPFQSLSLLSGVGRGSVNNAEFSLTYGLPPQKAASFLGLSADRLAMP